MPKLIVLLNEGLYKTVECEPEFELKFLNGIIGGWPECALQVPNPNYLFGEITQTDWSLDLWCDEEGHLKRLPFTVTRPTDMHPLVGPVVVCNRREFWCDDGRDFRLRPFDDNTTRQIQGVLRERNWAEELFNSGDWEATDTDGGEAA